MSQNDGTGTFEGDPLEEDFDLYQEGIETEEDDLESFMRGERDDEGTGEGEGDPEDDSTDGWEERYKNLQSAYDKSQNELKMVNERNSSYEHKFTQFGGVDQALAALNTVTSDKDFLDLAAKKREGRPIDGIDEDNLSPEGKQALKTIRQVASSTVNPLLQKINELEKIISDNIQPATNAIKDVNLDHHIDKMTEKYGPDWMKQLDSMESLKDSLSPQQKLAPSFDDLDSLFIESLRRDGKLDAFAISRAKQLTKAKTTKTTKRPSSTASEDSQVKTDTKKPGEKITMQEAARRALLKAEA